MLRSLILLLLIGTAAGPRVAGRPQRSCSGFSTGVPVAHTGMTWQFRLCSDSHGRELQLRFHNHRPEPVAFAYVALGSERRDCASAGGGLFRGHTTLGPGEQTHWPYARHRLDPERPFHGQVWLCVDLAPGTGRLAHHERSN